MSIRFQATVVGVLTLVLATLSCFGLFSAPDKRIEDGLFRLRHQLGWDPVVDPRIVVVELDEALFDLIGQPISRWSDDYAKLIERLFAGGAKVVAFDILFRPHLEKLPAEDANRIYEEVQALAFLCLEKPVVIIDALPEDESSRDSIKETLISIDILHTVTEDKGNVGLNNLVTDSDGIVRSLGLFFYDQEPHSIRNFAGRIAELALDSSIVLKGNKVEGLVAKDGEKMRINYPGPASSTFRRLKASQILTAEKSPELQGAICLIGPTYTSVDLHSTPLDSAHTWGIDIHASALNTILTDSFLVEAPPWLHFFLCLGLSSIAFLLGRKSSPPAFIIGLSCFLSAYLLLSFLVFVKARILLPFSAPYSCIILSGSMVAFARYRTLESSRRYVKSVLGRFVSPQVMEELLASPDNLQLGGRRRRITVLFTDINNFTPQCEKKSPEEVIAMLNDFFNEMLEIIFRYNGTVKQFVGDEIMVMYGAPNPMEDHAKRAVQTARDMVSRLTELREKHGAKAGFYEVKVGIHSGDVVVGNVGNEKRSEYAAVGDAVNTTARIEGLTKELGEAILVSEETLKELGGDLEGFTFVSKGPQSFKGKADQMEVFGIRWT